MAESADENRPSMCDKNEEKENLMAFEPPKKKIKTSDSFCRFGPELEDRLSGILCCAVCLDLPRTCYQCTNGHLMCAGCFNHLLADARLKDEMATCPNCRCEISKSLCTRNLAVEKAASELPTDCQFCGQKLPRNMVSGHERELCQERPTTCKYSRIGCPWRGPFHEVAAHESNCIHPQKAGLDIIETLRELDEKKLEEQQIYSTVYSLLSFEKITFNDLQLKPYRTDDFITKLFYETSRFSAFNYQWVIKARVNSDMKNPAHTISRSLSYQLVLKSRISAPIRLHFLALKGPYGEMKVKPAIFEHEFTTDSTESELKDLPIVDSLECNKLLATKTINFRIILFQVV
ncbi:cysteine and histidine-rich protein 1-like [Gigantopelta aegis]|uniref:cysteine and histidine-rich protein 1-like n=1 Tax=Gigantopelta aegis TaxID=1735272 RepID=UPI001B88925C|nr:cysteine and histidine-rich protein 1-like [Gigantopelta aegis]